MAIQDLFQCSCCCSCGLCCSKDVLCDKCELSTLSANGIPKEYVSEIKGLKYKSRNHSNSFNFSELYKKLNEISRCLSNDSVLL